MTELIGPSRCMICGGEYGDHFGPCLVETPKPSPDTPTPAPAELVARIREALQSVQLVRFGYDDPGAYVCDRDKIADGKACLTALEAALARLEETAVDRLNKLQAAKYEAEDLQARLERCEAALARMTKVRDAALAWRDETLKCGLSHLHEQPLAEAVDEYRRAT